jgi:hypothetical protein
MHYVRRQTRSSFTSAGHYVRHYIGKLAGYDDMGVNEARMRQLSFASTAGFADGQLFLDSCCSRTIIHDAELLTNMAVPKHIMGIGGFKRIKHVGDLNMRMTDVQGKPQTVTVRDVYYEPTLTYNLVSVSDMMRSQYTSTFSPTGSTLEGPAGKFALTRTSDVYALPVDNKDQACAMGALTRMTAEELAHLRFNHCISPRKLAILSNSGARGIAKGLKADDWKCQICQHANIIRSPAAPAATGSDPFDMSFDLIDMTSIPTISGMRYCTIFVVRKTRFAHTFLHEKKDEFPAILDKLMARFDSAQRPKVLMCDGAGEYDSQEFRTVMAKYPGVMQTTRSSA